MPKAPRTALIAEGSVSQSWVGKLPGLRQHLGPVLGLSLRNASRTVNQMKAGTASDDFAGLQKFEVVLISVPDAKLDTWIHLLAELAADWQRTSFVLCSSTRHTACLAPLRQKGATTASLSEMEGFLGKRYLFEGQKVALHRLRRLIETSSTARVLEITEGRRAIYDAGLTFASGMTFPMIASAVDSMRAAGLHANIAENVVETAVIGALRAYLRAGRRGWSGPIAKIDREELGRQYQALFEVDPELSEIYLKIAVDFLAELAAQPKARAATT
jgi:predicted short-subunit dehydrogenase-like oxidoreductase (DUF2520 family)